MSEWANLSKSVCQWMCIEKEHVVRNKDCDLSSDDDSIFVAFFSANIINED